MDHRILVFKVAVLYRIGLPSNTATLLALFDRRKLHNSSICTNSAIMLKNSCIRSMTCFTPLRLDSYPTDGHMDSCWEKYLTTNVVRGINIAYQRRILLG